MLIGMDKDTPHPFILDKLEEVLSIKGDVYDSLGGGGTNSVPYNTAWVARVANPEGEPEFPDSLDWLVASQRDDGSWGSVIFQEYDRITNTLAAAIALKQWDHDREAVTRAEAYIRGAVEGLEGKLELRGSDHLVAMLMEEARQVGLDIPYHKSPHRMMSYWKRLYLSYAYASSDHALSWLSEVLGRTAAQRRMVRRTQMGDGSLSSDTATTAASLVFESNPRLDHSYYARLRFLREYSSPSGGMPHLGDCEPFEKAYNLYSLMWVLPRPQTFFDEAMKLYRENWTPEGLPFSNHFNAPDLDNTAMFYRVLAEIGHEPDPHSLDNFWKGEYWIVYQNHDGPYIGPNLHTLEALAVSTHPDRDHLIDATLRYLKRIIIDGDHFMDEWHLSFAYPTSHAIRAFHLTEETLMERCLSFFLDSQKEDGSWGFIDNGNGLGTLEETAFALQGLLYYNQQVERIDMTPVHKGVEFVLERYPCVSYPDMWVGKVLYSPVSIIEGVIDGALLMYRNAMRSDAHGTGESHRWY